MTDRRKYPDRNAWFRGEVGLERERVLRLSTILDDESRAWEWKRVNLYGGLQVESLIEFKKRFNLA